MYFDYEGSNPELAQLRKGLAQMLIADLAGQARFQVVERGKLEALLSELKLSGTSKIDRASALRMGRMLAARYMVFGSIMDIQGTLMLQARVVEVETTQTIRGIRHQGPAATFFPTYEGFQTDLKAALIQQLPALSQGPGRKGKKRARPTKLSARTVARLGTALDASDRGDAKTARTTLEGIIAENPCFLLAKTELKKLGR